MGRYRVTHMRGCRKVQPDMEMPTAAADGTRPKSGQSVHWTGRQSTVARGLR